MDDAVTRLAVEWVLTNGGLTGFKERVDASLSKWETVGPEGMTVYRAHGHTKPGIVCLNSDPKQLCSGVRPVLATSKDLKVVKEFSGLTCCIFSIHLREGVRYLDITKATEGVFDNDSVFTELRTLSCESDPPKWPCSKNKRFPPRVLWSIFSDRVRGKPGKLPEQEVLVYENGAFGKKTDGEPTPEGVETFNVDYAPKVGGRSRGRTFRSTSKRRNKNGRRLTRQSKHHVRNRDA